MNILSRIKLSTFDKKYWLKIFAVALIATGIFYSLLELFAADKSSRVIEFPKKWQKIELTLHGNYFAQAGEYISVIENTGKIIIQKGLLLEIKRNDQILQDNPFGNVWKAIIATANLDSNKLKEINLKRAEQLYLAPYNKNSISMKTVQQKDPSYEINY